MEKPLVAMVALRLLSVACAVGLALSLRLPWWFAAAVVTREALAGVFIAVRAVRRREAPDTDPLAPAGALLVIAGMAAIAVGHSDVTVAVLARVFGWALAWWGLALSWAIVVDRALQLRRLAARDPHRGTRPDGVLWRR